MKKYLRIIKESLERILKSRTFYVGLAITIAMTAITVRLYYLQIVGG